MSDNQIFNLKKIKELTNPIEDLQVELNQLNDNSLKLTKNIQTIENNINNKNYLSQITTIKEIMHKINEELNIISNTNLNKFLDFQDQLIKKYKEDFKKNLKKLNIDEEKTKTIGLTLIEAKKISEIIDSISQIPSIEIQQWLELLDSLKYNTIFLETIKKTKNYYHKLIEQKLEKELSKIPEDIDSNLINEYKKIFKDNPILTFEEFFQTIENQLTQKELNAKKSNYYRVKRERRIRKIKKETRRTKYCLSKLFKTL